MPSTPTEHDPPAVSGRRTPAVPGPWSLNKLAALAGETEADIRGHADAGLLHRQADGQFEPESLHRLRLIQFARNHGVSEDQLAAAIASQGDLLGIFDELVPVGDGTVSLVDAARELGLDDAMINDLAEILDWNDVSAGTESDVATLHVLVKALALGMPRDALMQLIRVFADATDRLADAIARTFHDYVHERSAPRDSPARSCSQPAWASASHCWTWSNRPSCTSTGGPISAPVVKTCCAI